MTPELLELLLAIRELRRVQVAYHVWLQRWRRLEVEALEVRVDTQLSHILAQVEGQMLGSVGDAGVPKPLGGEERDG